MSNIFVEIIITVISGCVVAIFTQWLRNRNEK